MRTTTLIALIGTTAATQTAAQTAEAANTALLVAHCGDKKTGCTAAMCWYGGALNATDPYKVQCAKLDTDADKCQYGKATAANAAKCTSKVCDATTASKLWDNCKTHAATCSDTPQTETCWSTTDAADNCQFAGKGCTATLCHGHESLAEVTTTPAATGAGAAWNAKFWSERCTFKKVQNMRLADVKDTADWTKVNDKTKSDLNAATTKKTTECPKTDTDTTACTDAKAALEKQTIYTAANTTFYTVDKQNTLQAAGLTACKAESTDADCKTLQTTTDAAVTAADNAGIACQDTKEYKALTSKAAKLSKCQTEYLKISQVSSWQKNVNDALTPNYNLDTSDSDYQKWLNTWFEGKFTSAKTLAEQKALQATAVAAHKSAQTAYTAAKDKVASTAADVKTTDAANKATGHDATTATAWDTAKKASATAVSDEGIAKKKVDYFKSQVTYANNYVDGDSTAAQARQYGWMTYAMEHSALKSDAQVLQNKNVKDFKAAQEADDAASTTATRAKVEELTKWVAEGAKILANAWNHDDYEQTWQFTWFKNHCEALLTKDDMEKEQVKNTVDLADTKEKLAAAERLQASTAKGVIAAKARVATKESDKETARADKDTNSADTMTWDSAVYALTNAQAHLDFQEKAHTAATDDVDQWTAKIAVLQKWITWGEDRLTNTYQTWQVTWMKNKIAGMSSYASADAVQEANKALLKTHEDAAKTATGEDKDTLDKQVAQETAWVAAGKAALEDASNLNTWHTEELKGATIIKTAKALLDKNTAACKDENQACTWKIADAAHLKTLNEAKKARDLVNTQAAAAVKTNQTKDQGATAEIARAELAKLRSDMIDYTQKLKLTADEIQNKDCAVVNADTAECEKLARTYDAQDSKLKALTAAVAAQKEFLLTNKFKTSGDDIIAIIILLVTAFICIGGGVVLHFKGKADAKKKEEKKKEEEGMDKAGEADVKAADAETGLNFNDDCYHAMVDAEY